MKAFFFKDKRTGQKRNTPVYAANAKAARSKLRRPSPKHAVVYAVRERTPPKGGRWDRRGPNGGIKQHRGFGPQGRRR